MNVDYLLKCKDARRCFGNFSSKVNVPKGNMERLVFIFGNPRAFKIHFIELSHWSNKAQTFHTKMSTLIG